MNIKLFGHRVLVEHHKLSDKETLIIMPDAAQQHDTHRLGKVVAIGDGKTKTGIVPTLVKEGDIVLFQINQIMEHTQTFVLNGRTYMNLLQTELLARVNGEKLTADNIEMLGDWLLLKHFVRDTGRIVLPKNLNKQAAPEFIYFRCMAKGSTIDKPFELEDELIVNLGRLTPVFFAKKNQQGTYDNEEYCYTHKDWVDGKIETPFDATSN